MDSAAQLSAPVVDPLTVGKAFVMQYYEILYNMPEHLYRFYKDISKVRRVGQDGVMRDYSTLQGITEVLKKLSYGDFKSAEISSYDTQESHSGGFIVVVIGYFTIKERVRKRFTQTFFLAPQENGFFVLNDILRFDDELEATDSEVVPAKDSEIPSPINGNQGSEHAVCVTLKPSCKEVSMPMNNENALVSKENVLVSEIINEEIPDDGLEDVPKKSYASVLKVKKDNSGASTHSPKQITKEEDHQVSSDPFPKEILKVQDHEGSSDPSPVVECDAVSEVVDGTENEHNHGFEGAVVEGTSIYVKHLPVNVTIAMLETEFKQFGAISDGGIQVINYMAFGYPFGFVEFEEADAAQKAIGASPISIGGQRAFVEEKRSTWKGNRSNAKEFGNRNVGGARGRGRGGAIYGYRRGGRSFNRRGNNDYFANRINTY